MFALIVAFMLGISVGICLVTLVIAGKRNYYEITNGDEEDGASKSIRNLV